MTSHVLFVEWIRSFCSELLTGALSDRLTHNVHNLEMNGESDRFKRNRKSGKPCTANTSRRFHQCPAQLRLYLWRSAMRVRGQIYIHKVARYCSGTWCNISPALKYGCLKTVWNGSKASAGIS